ncbi:callose synthase 3-like [Dorcoceras hygrometricum]|uniref:Callose synthase 3-like n=1 Tax=Dorcoceras hygrometricum TaxID=472368 RepID=A0A2Z7B9M3_9LAMI|nr:callose synthase 3-like [Dorcoceras hygrometricum]
MPTITMGDGVSFPSAKILSVKTVNTYIATNTTIDAREEQGMVSEATVKRTPKSKKKSSPADDTPVKGISEIAGSKKRVATEDNAPAIPKKRRTVKTKPSFSQASLDIVNVAQDVVSIQLYRGTREIYRKLLKSSESPPAISTHQDSSSSSTDVSVHFDSTDIPVNAQADTQTSAPVDFTMFTDALEDLRSSLAQCILDSNCEILSKVNAVELGVRGDLLKLQVLLRQSLENACRVLERQGTTQATQINDLKKGLMAPVGTIFQDLFDIKKKQREQDAKLIALDGQIAAIRSEQLDFQTKIAADILSLSTQVGDIADYIRGGVAKKGEISSSSRPSTVRTQTFPPTTGTFAERAEQARRHILESGQVISIE